MEFWVCGEVELEVHNDFRDRLALQIMCHLSSISIVNDSTKWQLGELEAVVAF